MHLNISNINMLSHWETICWNRIRHSTKCRHKCITVDIYRKMSSKSFSTIFVNLFLLNNFTFNNWRIIFSAVNILRLVIFLTHGTHLFWRAKPEAAWFYLFVWQQLFFFFFSYAQAGLRQPRVFRLLLGLLNLKLNVKKRI